jgi:tRNA-specific 2-thiouridylase
VRNAARVAEQLRIPHHVVDVHREFNERVIGRFVLEYLAGRTPSPCVVCNREIKFGILLDAAKALGARFLATGHYAGLERPGAGPVRLLRGVDRKKDQSYFLARLSADQLLKSVFPLGWAVKPQVYEYAHARGLACRPGRESQEICFVEDGDHGRWIDVRRFETPGPGDIVDRSGRTVGRHAGIHHYTIGQRRGLGVAAGKRLFVSAIDAAHNRIVVGERADAFSSDLKVRDLSWSAGAAPSERFEAAVQIRYHHVAGAACVHLDGETSATVRFAEPQFAVTPGQLAALYRGSVVLGGGWIEGPLARADLAPGNRRAEVERSTG